MNVTIISSHILKFKICCVKLDTIQGPNFFDVAFVENIIPYLSKPLRKQPTYDYFQGLNSTLNIEACTRMMQQYNST